MSGPDRASRDRLRIALVAPPWYPVPPTGYGGIELVVYLLADELVKLGHDVTVFGRQGGRNGFELIALAPESWTSDLETRQHQAREATYLRRTYEMLRRRSFDVIHENSGYAGLLIAAMLELQAAPLATLHGDLTEADGRFLSTIDRNVDLVAISRAQQGMVAGVRWAAVVHNAIDERHLRFGEEPGDYLLDLARINPQKGQHVAIEVARRAGKRLVLAGKVDVDAGAYFREQVEPHLGRDVEWREDVGGHDKAELLKGAAALVFPIQWEEPFGLAMAEAMASGTPVIATPRGAAVELVDEGVTGFLAEDVDGLVDAVRRIDEIDRRACADHARDRFSPRRMAEGYEAAYRAAISRKRDR